MLARPMCSAGTPLLSVMCVHTEFARRAFFVAGPVTVYNSLPANIRLCHIVDSFKCHLKIHFLRMHQSVCHQAAVSKDTIGITVYKCCLLILALALFAV